MMRICQVMLAGGFGGAERYFVDLSRELARGGHNVLAVCHPGGVARETLGLSSGVEVATIRSLAPWDPFATAGLRAIFKDYRPQVVHAHLARAAHLAGKALRDSPVPLLAKTHNYVKLKYYRHVDMFLPTTRDQAAYLGASGIAPERLRVIPNFSALSTAKVPQDRAQTIVTTGRFVRKKGFQVLLAALSEVRRRGVALPPVLIAGDGPIRGELERAARQRGVLDVVQFVGWQADTAAFLDRGTLFVLPSLDEPFGIAVLEAMARGLPVIATATQGPREVLDADVAMLVPPGDATALAEALMRSLADAGAARGRAALATQKFRTCYAADVVVPQVVSAYESVLQSGAQKTGGA